VVLAYGILVKAAGGFQTMDWSKDEFLALAGKAFDAMDVEASNDALAQSLVDALNPPVDQSKVA